MYDAAAALYENVLFITTNQLIIILLITMRRLRPSGVMLNLMAAASLLSAELSRAFPFGC